MTILYEIIEKWRESPLLSVCSICIVLTFANEDRIKREKGLVCLSLYCEKKTYS